MNKKVITLFFVSIWMLASCSWGNAQKDVVTYLEERFEQKNIPVTEITILERTPLSIQIMIQARNPWTTAEDMHVMSLVDREIQFFAAREGYKIDSYTKILVGSDGRELELMTQKTDLERTPQLNLSHAVLPDKAVQNKVVKEIPKLVNTFSVEDVNFDISISSDEGFQTLIVNAKAESLDQANKISLFLWALPDTSLIEDINSQGARIIFYKAKLIDEDNEILFDYVKDLEMGIGGWNIDDRLQNPSGDGPPPPSEP